MSLFYFPQYYFIITFSSVLIFNFFENFFINFVAHSPLSYLPLTSIINYRGGLMNMSIQKKFGYCIRIFRQNLGLSQEKFSLKIGMDRTYYASVEN